MARLSGIYAVMPWWETIKFPVEFRSLTEYTLKALAEAGKDMVNCSGCGNAAIVTKGSWRCHRCEGTSKSEWEKRYEYKTEFKKWEWKNGQLREVSEESSHRDLSPE
jgi:hypothetical protein